MGVCNTCTNNSTDLRNRDYSNNELQLKKSEMKNSMIEGNGIEKKKRKKKVTRESIDSFMSVQTKMVDTVVCTSEGVDTENLSSMGPRFESVISTPGIKNFQKELGDSPMPPSYN